MYNKIITQFMKYFVGAGTAFFVDFSILYLLVHYFGLYYIISNIISYTTGVFVSFYLNKKYTFSNDYKNHFRQFIVFGGISLFNLVIVSIILYYMVEYLNVYFVFSKIIATGVSFVINFVGHKYITFKFMK